MDRIVLIGAVGTALNIIYQISDAISRYKYPAELIGIVIDSFKTGSIIGGIPVISSSHDIHKLTKKKGIKFIYCLYHMDKMEERFDLLKSYNIPEERYANFFHPLSYISPDLIKGYGNVILSNSTIQSGVILGNNNIINSNITIEHDTLIGDGNFISSNACIGAYSFLGQSNFIGTNSTIREKTRLSRNVFVGAHSLVISNFESCRVWGTPAVLKDTNNVRS